MNTPPVRLLRDARTEGEQAAQAGQRMADNPHTGDTPKDRVLAQMWDTGFTKADPLNIDYAGDASNDYGGTVSATDIPG